MEKDELNVKRGELLSQINKNKEVVDVEDEAFNWKLFKVFIKAIVQDKDFVMPLLDDELTDVDLKSSLFSVHAIERVEERYRDNIPELLSSLNTNQFIAYRQTRRRVLCGGWRIDCSRDLKYIFTMHSSRPIRSKKCPNLKLGDIGSLKCALEKYCPDIAVNIETCNCVDIGDIVTVQVITTTTRFVLNENCRRIITVIPLSIDFFEWQYRYKWRFEKRSEWWQHS